MLNEFHSLPWATWTGFFHQWTQLNCSQVFWLPSNQVRGSDLLTYTLLRVSRNSDKWGHRSELWGQATSLGEGGTFTGGCAAMVFKVGAVLAFIVLSTLAEIVAGTVVALGTVLTGIGLTIIYVQLQGPGAAQWERKQ